jgi:hypothetical protein
MFRYGAFGWVALPSLWLYQILFPAISPIMDIMIVRALFSGDFLHFGAYYGAMLAVEFAGACVALSLDRGQWRLLPWLFLQRLVYRQLIYYVIIKSLVAAVQGRFVAWNKLDRLGTSHLGLERAPAQEMTLPPVL